MAINTRREGFLDFLLAGFAGGATGAAAGLEIRQGRKEREVAAQSAAQFKQMQLNLQREGIDIQRLSAKSLEAHRKETTKLAQERFGFDKEQARTFEQELEKIEAGRFSQKEILEQITTRRKKAPLSQREINLEIQKAQEQRFKNLALEQKLQLDFEAGERSEKATELAQAQFEFDQIKETTNNDFRDKELQFRVVELISKREGEFVENETNVWIAGLPFLHKQLDDKVNPFERDEIGETYRAIERASESGKEFDNTIANQHIANYNKLVKKYAPDITPKQKVDFRRKGFLGRIFGENIQQGLLPPEEELIGPQPAPQQPTAPLEGILGPLGAPPVRDTSQSDALLQSIFGEPEQQQPALPIPTTRTPADITQIISHFKEIGRTTLTKVDKDTLKELGFNKSDIEKINKGL